MSNYYSTTTTEVVDDASTEGGGENGGDDGVVVGWSPVVMTALISCFQGTVLYCFFLYQRRCHRQEKKKSSENKNASYYDLVYEPRRNKKRSHRSPRQPPFGGNGGANNNNNSNNGSWLYEVWNTDDYETLRRVGLDSYMFLRLLRMGARICYLGSFMACILIPVYFTGNATGPSTEGFNQLTLARVEEGGNRLWASLICWCIFVGFVLYQFYNEWRVFAENRSDYLARGDADNTPKETRYAVRVEQIPSRYRTNRALKAYFLKLFPDHVHETQVYYETRTLQKLVDERQVAITKLESAVAFTIAKPDKPRPLVKVAAAAIDENDEAAGAGGSASRRRKICGGNSKQKVDAITHYESEIASLNQEIDEERKKYPNTTDSVEIVESAAETELPEEDNNAECTDTSNNNDSNASNSNTANATSTGFVTFGNLRAKQAAVQCELTGNPNSMVVFPADDPKSVLWKNVEVPLNRQRVFTLQAAVFWTVGILFWAVPVSFVTSIANLNSILQAFGLPTADPSAAWYGLIAGLLPVIFLAILMAVLYMSIVAAATKFIRLKSVPEVDTYTLFWHQMFQFANLWLILIGGSLFNQIDSIIADPTSIISVIATAMPGASMFFVNMILVGSFGAFGMELSMIPKYAVGKIMNCIKPEPMRTQRDIDASKEAPSIVWGKKIPPIIFIFLVSIMYMPIVPIMEIFAVVYFTGTYFVMKHQCLHVYDNKFEGGGKVTWSSVFGFLMASLYMSEAVFIAYMGLKKAAIQGALAFLPLGATVLVDTMLKRNIIKPLENLSLEVAADVDIEDGELAVPVDKSKKLYGIPALDTSSEEERGPMPYRRIEEEAEATSNDVELGTSSDE